MRWIIVTVLLCAISVSFGYPPQHPTLTFWKCQAGNTAQQVTCETLNTKHFQYKLDAKGFFHILNLPNKCLQLEQDGTWFMYGCNEGEQAQKFVYDPTSKTISNTKTDWSRPKTGKFDKYNLIPENKAMMAAAKKCLSVTVSSTDPTGFGTPPLFQECKVGDQSQQWTYDATKGTITPVNSLLATLCLDYAQTWQCDQPNSLIAKYPFCNHNLTSEERAEDIVARMTPEEKVQQMLSVAPAIPRLGIGRYDWWSEALVSTFF
jgi:hypothetical protein